MKLREMAPLTEDDLLSDLPGRPTDDWTLREKLRGTSWLAILVAALVGFVLYHITHLPPDVAPLTEVKCSAAIRVVIYADGTPASASGLNEPTRACFNAWLFAQGYRKESR